MKESFQNRYKNNRDIQHFTVQSKSLLQKKFIKVKQIRKCLNKPLHLFYSYNLNNSNIHIPGIISNTHNCTIGFVLNIDDIASINRNEITYICKFKFRHRHSSLRFKRSIKCSPISSYK